jgi:hypothetical protein
MDSRTGATAMKVNFWQILGIILIVVGVVFFARSKMGKTDEARPTIVTQPSAATAPATQAAP